MPFDRVQSWENSTALRALEDQKSAKPGGFRRTQHLAPYQCLGEGRAGSTAKKDFNNSSEASMCLKTNKSLTKWLEKSRTFMARIRIFAYNRHEFCRKKRFGDDNLQVQFDGLFYVSRTRTSIWAAPFSRRTRPCRQSGKGFVRLAGGRRCHRPPAPIGIPRRSGVC